MIRLLAIAAAAFVWLASSTVRADTPNEITAVSYSEDPVTATTPNRPSVGVQHARRTSGTH